MKRVLLLCLIGMAAVDTHAATSNPPQPVQAFSAVLWTTTTLHSPAGKPSTFMQRTVYTRDASGNVRREIYRPTKGFSHDTTAPLERVLTGSTSAQTPPLVLSSKEIVEQDADLGTLQLSGFPATGKRRIFQDANGQRTHTLETWFSPSLGLTVHMESRNARGDTVVSDLSDLQLGNPVSSSAEMAPVASPPIPLLNLYRGLFTLIAHMERDRLANDPTRHVNMDEIEDHLRKQVGLSASEWQVLLDKSVKVESYTREMSKQAHSFADQDRAARQQTPLSANSLAVGRATLHKMQLDLNAHVQGEIDQLKTAVGPDATTRIEAYLQGPLAASTSRITLTSAQLQAMRAQKEQAR
ncbi:MAG: hypothetical protein ABR905_19275 [Terracidiphilus sp.]|jgi:hypothetical protein